MVVEVVADPSQADPEGQEDQADLEEGSENLKHPVEDPDSPSVPDGEGGEPGLEVEDEEGGAVEGEGGVAGEEGEARIMKLFAGRQVHLEALADVTVGLRDEPGEEIKVIRE